MQPSSFELEDLETPGEEGVAEQCLVQEECINHTIITIWVKAIFFEMNIGVYSLTDESPHRDHGQSI